MKSKNKLRTITTVQLIAGIIHIGIGLAAILALYLMDKGTAQRLQAQVLEQKTYLNQLDIETELEKDLIRRVKKSTDHSLEILAFLKGKVIFLIVMTIVFGVELILFALEMRKQRALPEVDFKQQ